MSHLSLDADWPDGHIWKKMKVDDEGAPHLWQRFLKTWDWRRKQLDSGRFEVVLEKNPEAEGPENGMDMEELNKEYNDYVTLAGWGEITMSRLIFIRAGAGSGKTFTLTQKLGELLDAGAVRPSGVIATTFTKKAVTELRERVIKTDDVGGNQ